MEMACEQRGGGGGGGTEERTREGIIISVCSLKWGHAQCVYPLKVGLKETTGTLSVWKLMI